MTDSFLASVTSYDSDAGVAVVVPLITEYDGTDHPAVNAIPVAGVFPSAGDIALIVTIRNGEDNAAISRYFEASEAHCRIVHIVTSAGGVFLFKGNYKFTGNIEIEGELHVTGAVTLDDDLSVGGDLSVDGDSDLTGDLSVGGDANFDGTVDVTGTATFGGIAFGTHVHTSASPGNPTGPPQAP